MVPLWARVVGRGGKASGWCGVLVLASVFAALVCSLRGDARE